jgi:hypothetical protein
MLLILLVVLVEGGGGGETIIIIIKKKHEHKVSEIQKEDFTWIDWAEKAQINNSLIKAISRHQTDRQDEQRDARQRISLC